MGIAATALAAAFDGRLCAETARPMTSEAALKSFKEHHQKNGAMVMKETIIFQYTAMGENAQVVGL